MYEILCQIVWIHFSHSCHYQIFISTHFCEHVYFRNNFFSKAARSANILLKNVDNYHPLFYLKKQTEFNSPISTLPPSVKSPSFFSKNVIFRKNARSEECFSKYHFSIKLIPTQLSHAKLANSLHIVPNFLWNIKPT